MLAFTADVRDAMRWFEWTHELAGGGLGAPRWTRIAFPGPGALGEQDTLTMQELQHLRSVMNDIVAHGQRAGSQDDELTRFREQHGRNRQR